MLETVDIPAEKKALRAAAIERRSRAAAAIDPADVGSAIRDRFFATIPIQAAVPVSGFWPMGDEIDCRPLLLALAERGHEIGLPIVVRRGEPLVFRRWRPGQALVPGGFNVMVPAAEEPEVVPALVITPLLAFDRAGYRVGYGGGFYDRTLAKLRAAGPVLSVGVAYAGQEIAAVPRDAFDQPMDWIVTEQGAMRFEGGR